jgi:hypothetical protein
VHRRRNDVAQVQEGVFGSCTERSIWNKTGEGIWCRYRREYLVQVQEGVSGAGTGKSIWCRHRTEYLVHRQEGVSSAGTGESTYMVHIQKGVYGTSPGRSFWSRCRRACGSMYRREYPGTEGSNWCRYRKDFLIQVQERESGAGTGGSTVSGA